MSTIQKMTIQGIRSFGPDDKDKQLIQFFNPLTLILGPNGTGKTTVIECLHYLTTGDMPPGSKGGAFIHDPKVAHEREVKGQVRLQFKDVSGQLCIVQRSLTATQKLKKIEMKTLEGVITRKGPDGEKKSITSRCAEINNEMITSLGVSKAVLENVIFCHQEESNWPLSEGKSLKDKFDAIFASTRYVKALDSIRKTKQEQDDKIKFYKQDIKYLKDYKDKATQLEGDLNELEAKYVSSKESVETIKEQLMPIEERLMEIQHRSNDIYELKTKIEKISSEKKQLEKSINEIRSSIENEFKGTPEELQRVIADFEEKVQGKKRKLREFEEKQSAINKELEKIRKEKSSLLMTVGKLEQEAETHEANIDKRDSKIRTLAEEYEFEGFERGEITDEKYRTFFENMKAKLESMMEQSKTIKAKFDVEENNIQEKIDSLKKNKTELETNMKMKQNKMNENNREIRDINRKLSEVEASASRLDQLNRDLKKTERNLQDIEGTVNVEDTKREIEKLAKQKTVMDSTSNELNSEMKVLHLQSEVQSELENLKKQKTQKEEGIRRIKTRHEDTLKYILGYMPTDNVRGLLDEYISKQTESMKRCSVQVQQSNKTLSSKEAEHRMLKDQLKRKEESLKGIEDKISGVCGSQNFDDGFTMIQQKMTQAQDQKGSLLGAEHFFKKYVDDLKKKDPCCPLCLREFDTEQEVRELILELEKKLRLVPSKLQRADRDLDEYRHKYDSMNQLMPLKENIIELEENEIPELKRKVKKTNEEIEKLKAELVDKEDELMTKETDEGTAKELQPDIVLMDRSLGEIRDLDRKIAVQSSKLSGGDSGRTLQDVMKEKDEIQIDLDTVNRQLDTKRQKLSDYNEQVQQLKSKMNDLTQEKLRIERDLQERCRLEENKASFASENENFAADIEEAKRKLKPLSDQIEKHQNEKSKVVVMKEDELEEVKEQIDRVRLAGNGVKNKNTEIKAYLQSGKADTLVENKERVDEFSTSQKNKEKKLDDLNENINTLRKEIASQQMKERELQDNLQLFRKEKEVESMNTDMEELEDKLGGLDPTKLEKERRKLHKQQEDLTKERLTAVGRQTGFEEQIRNMKKELKTDMYKDAGKKYRDKMIELRTTELAKSDLEKYYKALDKAIMNYHIMKMEELNKIIRELWRNTYRGNDIETIEIRSDEDDSGIMKTRRNYNYRVVMLKADTALDMRGRCSAGQKVLASLIIRLALAETFCLNCGILALDEPTTNLDRENIESLAYALVEIIKARAHQRNFQLLVITHDEDFVELLGRSEYVDDFYKVSKNSYGCSQLKKACVKDLHMR